MIKSISLLRRKDEITHQQFVRHWVEIHAPLAHQSHGGPRRAPPIPPDARSAPAKPLHADGALFIGRIKTFTVEERVIV